MEARFFGAHDGFIVVLIHNVPTARVDEVKQIFYDFESIGDLMHATKDEHTVGFMFKRKRTDTSNRIVERSIKTRMGLLSL